MKYFFNNIRAEFGHLFSTHKLFTLLQSIIFTVYIFFSLQWKVFRKVDAGVLNVDEQKLIVDAGVVKKGFNVVTCI